MKNRVLRNYATTILGVLILGYCVYSHNKGAEWSELIGFFGMATLLLRSKDSLIGLPKE
jgi:cytochrome b